MKRMLINATQPEELRVALIDGQSIYDFDIEQQGQERKRSNIYKAKVSRIEPSLGAAFVDFGAEKHGFLPTKELAPSYLNNKNKKSSISDYLTQGQEIIVQVDKEERGSKGAALTTLISLPGHYLVLMPNNPEAGGISRSLEGEERQSVKENFKSLEVPESMGLIVRTAARGASLNELKWDLEYLLSVWDAILEANQLREAPFLIYRDDDLISRSLRDFLREDITEVLIDSQEAYEKAYDFASRLAPDLQDRIKIYEEIIPLFTRYQVESQIETAYQRKVQLNSGGSIVIDQTEALVSIDINSAKSTSGSNIEETAVKTNVEAAKEIAKQLRLRDIGGLIVIDFIDMGSLKNKRIVEDMIHESISIDRAKIQVGRISRFGLLEMSRQRLRPSLQERWTQDIGSLSTAVLRLIEEEAGKKKSGEVRAIVSSDMSVFLLNERRSRINEIEERSKVRVVVVSDPNRSDNRFEVTRIKSKDKKSNETSYSIQEEIDNKSTTGNKSTNKSIEKAVVEISPKKRPRQGSLNFISKLLGTISNKKQKPKTKINEPKKKLPKKENIPAKKNNRYRGKNKIPNYQDKVKAKNKKVNSQGKIKTQSKNKKENNLAPKKEPKETKPVKEQDKKTKTNNNLKKSKPKQPKKNLNPTASKVKEEDNKKEKIIKSAKEWGMASNDPRNKN